MKFKAINKDWIFVSVAAAFFILGIAFQFLTLRSVKQMQSKSEAQSTEESIAVVAEPKIVNDTLFTLYECGGKIGIYDAKSNIIIDIIDIFVSTLPQKDRAALKKGIGICSISELTELIEDFST